MTDPLVTVVTPTFQHEAFLGDCIRSVQAQTYRAWEMLVLDDGSTDGTVRVARGSGDGRVRVVERPHRGIFELHATYRAALEMARGSLVALLDGDDLWPPDRLETQVPLLADPRAVLAFGPAGTIGSRGALLAPATVPGRGWVRTMENAPVGEALRLLLGGNQIVSCTVLVSRSALERAGGFRQPPGLPAVDYPAWLALATLGEFRFTGRVMGYWRTHPAQASRQLHVALQAGAARHALDFFDRLDPALAARSGWSRRTLARRLLRAQADAARARARLHLLDGERRAAARLFLSSLGSGSARARASGLAGLLRAATGLDPIRIAGRRRRRPVGTPPIEGPP